MNDNTLHFRLATPQDAASIKSLIESAFKSEDSRVDWTADMRLSTNFSVDIDHISDSIGNADKAIIIAETDQNPFAGTISVAKKGDTCRLALLAVNPNVQRGGTGRQILGYAEKYCQETWNIKKFGLNAVSTRERLIDWYTRCGYRKTGETSPFPREEAGEAWVEGLCFVEMLKEVDGDAQS